MGYRQNQAFYLVIDMGDAGRRTPDTHRDAGHKNPIKNGFRGTFVKQKIGGEPKSVRQLGPAMADRGAERLRQPMCCCK
jgi:hypothetical protein